MNALLKLFAYLLALVVIMVAAAGGVAYHWATDKLALQTPYVDVLVPAGSNAGAIARIINQSGIDLEPLAFSWLARLSRLDKKIKAGGYQLKQGDTPWSVLQRMAQGDVSSRQVALIEGWTLKQIFAVLDAQPDLVHLLKSKDVDQIIQATGIQRPYAEGLFFPDTYTYFAGTSDAELLVRAYKTQQIILEKAWQAKDPNLPYQNSYEALILASIVEKETAKEADRPRVAAVYINRLRIGMKLDADPTVIYGVTGGLPLGRGIRASELAADTPYNTYVHAGLPPTAIANPGRASIAAVLDPPQTNELYFVADGTGGAAFAATLAEHEKNVARWREIERQKAGPSLRPSQDVSARHLAGKKR